MDYVHRSLKIFEEIGVGDHIADLHTNLGEAWLGLGEIEKAESFGKEAIKKFAELTTGKLGAHSEERARSLRLLGKVSLKRGQYSEAYRMLKQSQQIFEAIGNSLEQARTMVDLARTTSQRGNHQAARITLYEAKLIFEQFGAKQDLLLLNDFIAEHPNLNGFPSARFS
jgi:tetratricopeptide (TPR) repeat protein